MSGIKNIILDLGGVLLDIDYDLTTKAFEELGYKNFREMYSQYTADQLFEKLEKGEVSEEEFFTIMKSLRNEISSQQITHAWNAMLLQFRKKSFGFLDSLSTKFNLYLLSNTNAIHKKAFDKIFKDEMHRPMDSYFIKSYYSHEIGFRKPNADIYEFVLKDACITASETLFIDDSYNNIEAAKTTGIKTYLLQKGEVIENIIPEVIQLDNIN